VFQFRTLESGVFGLVVVSGVGGGVETDDAC
jgi:hypothetical protein